MEDVPAFARGVALVKLTSIKGGQNDECRPQQTFEAANCVARVKNKPAVLCSGEDQPGPVQPRWLSKPDLSK